jgi:curli biogenesis system outer membrane secretion channel CsgG
MLNPAVRFIASSAVLLTASAAFADSVTKTSEKDYELPHCSKPIASVMVGQVNCKSVGCQSTNQDPKTSGLLALAAAASGSSQVTFPGIGDGMSAMLVTVLKETGCFEIQEREALEELNKELALVGKKVEVQQADFMISGAITSIAMATERKQFLGGFLPIIGAISSTTKTADLGMDIKIIDVNRAKVLEAKTFVANNETSSYGFGGAAFGPGMGGMGGMSSIKGTPMEDVVRDVLVRVASFSSRTLVSARGVSDVTFALPPDTTKKD